MTNDVAATLTRLRKERGLGQQQAADDLGVSQPVLSHYERGLRACSLPFIVKAAAYYGVSCDYLLGAASQRGHDAAHAPAALAFPGEHSFSDALPILFALLEKINSPVLTQEATALMEIQFYKLFRGLYQHFAKKPADLFAWPLAFYQGDADAAAALSEARIARLLQPTAPSSASSPPPLSSSWLTEAFPQQAPGLFALIELAEASLSHLDSKD